MGDLIDGDLSMGDLMVSTICEATSLAFVATVPAISVRVSAASTKVELSGSVVPELVGCVSLSSWGCCEGGCVYSWSGWLVRFRYTTTSSQYI